MIRYSFLVSSLLAPTSTVLVYYPLDDDATAALIVKGEPLHGYTIALWSISALRTPSTLTLFSLPSLSTPNVLFDHDGTPTCRVHPHIVTGHLESFHWISETSKHLRALLARFVNGSSNDVEIEFAILRSAERIVPQKIVSAIVHQWWGAAIGDEPINQGRMVSFVPRNKFFSRDARLSPHEHHEFDHGAHR
jgi:hypothetical protein